MTFTGTDPMLQIQIAFKAEVDARAEELAVCDPRRKPSNPQIQALL
jgi:hypothetical protein